MHNMIVMGDSHLESINKILPLIAGYQRSRYAEMKRTGAIRSRATVSEPNLRAAHSNISFPRSVFSIWEVIAMTEA
jgi:hypothetical protein